MFTIEQSGCITRTNTIDGLINEYIKRYADNYVQNVNGNGNNVSLEAIKALIDDEFKNADYATIDDINNQLTNYATTSDLNNYATIDDINNQLTNYIKTSDLNNYATIDDINNQLTNYIKTSDLDNYVTTSDLNNYATIDDINNQLTNYATIDDIKQYRQQNDLSYSLPSTQLSITHKEYTIGGNDITFATSYVDYHEGAHLIGYINDDIDRSFDLQFYPYKLIDTFDRTVYYMYVHDKMFCWDATCGAIFTYDEPYVVHINEAYIESKNDKILLQSDYDPCQLRTRDDISYSKITDLPIVIKPFTFEDDYIVNLCIPHVPFAEGAHLIGTYLNRPFDIIFKTEGDQLTDDLHLHKMQWNNELVIWDALSGAIYVNSDSSHYINLTRAYVESDHDKIALLTEVEELISMNAPPSNIITTSNVVKLSDILSIDGINIHDPNKKLESDEYILSTKAIDFFLSRTINSMESLLDHYVTDEELIESVSNHIAGLRDYNDLSVYKCDNINFSKYDYVTTQHIYATSIEGMNITGSFKRNDKIHTFDTVFITISTFKNGPGIVYSCSKIMNVDNEDIYLKTCLLNDYNAISCGSNDTLIYYPLQLTSVKHVLIDDSLALKSDIPMLTIKYDQIVPLTFESSSEYVKTYNYKLSADIINDTIYNPFDSIKADLITLFDINDNDIVAYSTDMAGFIKIDLKNTSNNKYFIAYNDNITNGDNNTRIININNDQYHCNNDTGSYYKYSYWNNNYKVKPFYHSIYFIDTNTLYTDINHICIYVKGSFNVMFDESMINAFINKITLTSKSNDTYTVDFNNVNMSNITDLCRFAYDQTMLTSITFPNNAINNKVHAMDSFMMNCSRINSINLSLFHLDHSTLNSVKNMFNGCTSLQSIDMCNIDISNDTIDVPNMFTNCTSLNMLYINDASFNRIKDQLRTTFIKVIITKSKRECYVANDYHDDEYTTVSVSNTTITHYCPIANGYTIDDFIIGTPIYMTGRVYKYDRDNNTFIESNENDTTDCISSVKTTGSWNHYLGICVSIDRSNNCITFASGGDYLVKVDDSSCYRIGDEVFIDDDNKLKILAGATAITSKIKRMTVGIITSIINKNTLSVFR